MPQFFCLIYIKSTQMLWNWTKLVNWVCAPVSSCQYSFFSSQAHTLLCDRLLLFHRPPHSSCHTGHELKCYCVSLPCGCACCLWWWGVSCYCCFFSLSGQVITKWGSLFDPRLLGVFRWDFASLDSAGNAARRANIYPLLKSVEWLCVSHPGCSLRWM